MLSSRQPRCIVKQVGLWTHLAVVVETPVVDALDALAFVRLALFLELTLQLHHLLLHRPTLFLELCRRSIPGNP